LEDVVDMEIGLSDIALKLDGRIERWYGVQFRRNVAMATTVAAEQVPSGAHAANVVPIDSGRLRRSPLRGKPVKTVPGKKRGHAPAIGDRVRAEMRGHLERGEITPNQLDAMIEKTLASTYLASRDTCRKARAEVLSEWKSRQMATNDK
jgi:hypothetical protein